MSIGNLEFGVFDSTPIPDDGEPAATAEAYEAHIADAQLAETLGYKYFFFIEHQNAGFPCISAPTVYLTALARATRQIRIGAMIFQLPLHHPVRLAQDVAMIDHLSKGRVEFAFGYGTRSREFEPWRLDFRDRRKLGIEALDILLKTWTEHEVSYSGEHWTLEKALPQPRPYQQPMPPVWIGAHSLSSFEFAAERNFHVAQIFEVEKMVADKFAHFAAAWHKHGHKGPMPRRALVRHIHVAETDSLAREQAEPYMLRGITGPAGVERAMNLQGLDASPETREVSRVYLQTSKSVEFWLEEGLAFIGSPTTVAAAIAEQRERVGYDVLLLNHRFDGMPRELCTKSLKLFGERVIPQIAAMRTLSTVSA
jgi:alkanesulfonate monooxygenase SsuD/methylene tetrahydromethanopterin reductase-like flavin-dependent oxidoreductase (luciferase family)